MPGLAQLRPNFLGYALGVETRDYRGRQMLTHTGGLPGYVSRLAMIPSLRLGVAVLTNQESGLAFNALVYRVLDHYLGAKPPDYVGIYGRLLAQNRAKLAEGDSAAAAPRDSTAGPSLPLAKYAGVYRDAWYGDVKIDEERGGLVIRMMRTPAHGRRPAALAARYLRRALARPRAARGRLCDLRAQSRRHASTR